VTRAVIALGANLGDRGSTLRAAAAAVAAIPGVDAVSSSHEVESVALTLDGPDATKPRYRNAVVVVDTELSAQQLLDALHVVEDTHGRTREVRWGDRTLDLDVVTYGDEHIETPTLSVPHPRAHERAFVLAPWIDADPAAVLPGVGPVADLLAALGDDTERVDEPRLLDEPSRASRPTAATDPTTATEPTTVTDPTTAEAGATP
jgi:2-amino-4-hydroxy-6-hydroxymethyldihydropteridine diphosphokinase